MTSDVIGLNQLKQFYIITHLEFDLLLIIYQLTYLTFLAKLDQSFKSTYVINLQPTLN